MEKLKGLYPEPVFSCFEQICGIPHGSYHIDEISDYLKSFAERRGFSCVQDKEKNILVRLAATRGYEDEPVLILQGHMDMVAVHDDPAVDMTKHVLALDHDGEWVFAEHSSLGGDDGIAVAMMMALMEDPSIPHPALELLITANEEVGMDGAVGLDASLLKGKRLLNLDSEDEGIFTVGCAGGTRVVAHMPLTVAKAPVNGKLFSIKLSGGAGGHSGQMIDQGRANAIHQLGRILYELHKLCGACLVSMAGGTACNAIPGEAELALCLEDGEKAVAYLEDFRRVLKEEYRGKDEELTLDWSVSSEMPERLYDAECSGRLAAFLIAAPDGVQAMSGDVKGLVETSLNLGVLKIENDELTAFFELRSMIGSAAAYLRDRVAALITAFGGRAELSASYPEWSYRKDSPLRDKMQKVYRRMYAGDAKVELIHAGLECGVLAKKIEDFDAVSIGPEMQDIHSTRERLNIASVGRVWDYVLEVLKEKDD
ncbi:MAG: beta-Ala-His dipeptidase [Lachnospiraceae bacterium]|nr:beta-Ala-His dipeptidase [Lachnospiraceae bacterium]